MTEIDSTSRKPIFLIGFLLIIFISFFYFHLYDYLTLDTLTQYHVVAQDWTMAHYPLAVFLYILVFVLLIACAIPCATIFTLAGGFLFGYNALLYATFSTTMGGVVLFLAVRTAVGAYLAKKKTGWIKKMERGFQENAFNYIVLLRLVPIFPCWISNIAAGALNVPLMTFIVATILGILPATFVHVMAGRSLDTLLSGGKTPLMDIIFTPSVLLPLLGLAILSLFPVIYNSVKKTKTQ